MDLFHITVLSGWKILTRVFEILEKSEKVLLDLLIELLSKFVKPCAIKGQELMKVDIHSSSSHKENKNIVIGSAATNVVTKLSEEDQKVFYSAVVNYFVSSCEYVIKKFPLNSEILRNAEVANLKNIESATFSSVRYFVSLFPCILKLNDSECLEEALDVVENEFSRLQMEDSISFITDKFDRIDAQWAEVLKIRGADGLLKYGRLSRTILNILVIPHSNAECERVFSLVKKNRTEFRSNMSNKTLESLLVLKTKNSKSYHEQKFSDYVLQNAKKNPQMPE